MRGLNQFLNCTYSSCLFHSNGYSCPILIQTSTFKGPLTKGFFLFFSELLIPGTANVYYAINTQFDLNFVLREKPEDLNVSLASSTPGAGLSTTPHHGILGTGSLELAGTPKGLRKPSRDNSKARRKILGLAL